MHAPLIPTHDLTVYAVLEDFGKHGCAWREIDELRAENPSSRGSLRGEYERVLVAGHGPSMDDAE
jgi:hypothetical protein